jgi:hypothetical protein
MDGLERHVRQAVADWIHVIQERSPEPGEIDQVTETVTRIADDFIGTQVMNALS